MSSYSFKVGDPVIVISSPGLLSDMLCKEYIGRKGTVRYIGVGNKYNYGVEFPIEYGYNYEVFGFLSDELKLDRCKRKMAGK